MKKFYSIYLMITLMLLASCTQSQVKRFAEEFATAVANNDTASIIKMYPDATKADSLSLAFDAGKTKVEKQKDGSYRVTLGEKQDLVIIKNGVSGAFSVKDSHGVLVFSKSHIDFAIRTGLVKPDMSDVAIVTQLADTKFFKWISDKFMMTFREKFNVSDITDNRRGSARGGETYITIKNDCDCDIAGQDYRVIVSQNYEKEVVIEGKDIKSGSEETLKTGYLAPDFYTYNLSYPYSGPIADIKMNLSTIELLCKYYSPQGNEYENYLKTK